MSEAIYEWHPNWYATRLHAVIPEDPDDPRRALCGTFTWTPDGRQHIPWVARRMAGDVPRCANCLKRMAQHCRGALGGDERA